MLRPIDTRWSRSQVRRHGRQGHRLTEGLRRNRYTTNGLYAWVITHALFFALIWWSWIDPAMIARHWEGLLVISNAYGFVLSLLVQLKGYYAPSFSEDCKSSGMCHYQLRKYRVFY